MQNLIFATTNKGKLEEARSILGVEVEGTALEIDEIQSLDPETVALKKALAYYEQVQKPLFVEDVALTFNALNGLPGTYINDFTKALTNQGLIDLLKDEFDRSATAQTTIVFVDEKGETHLFKGLINGKISTEPKGDKGFGWDPIFIPEGESLTFAEMEMETKNKYSMRARALEEFKKWLDVQG